MSELSSIYGSKNQKTPISRQNNIVLNDYPQQPNYHSSTSDTDSNKTIKMKSNPTSSSVSAVRTTENTKIIEYIKYLFKLYRNTKFLVSFRTCEINLIIKI